ncbi:MAG: TetR/AcrR family transcriptional regulator [Chloroflexi bacterium]|nr:TetR/AcrR family transcriptional regulator [Chloroflexota bacterium]
MSDEIQTQEKIVFAALELFIAHGIKKTSVDEIAQHAGLTRVTVYRYYADKRDLVRAAFLLSERVFEQTRRDLDQYPERRLEEFFDQIGRGLAALPPGNPAARLEELRQLYPDIYAEYQQRRLAVEGDLFARLLRLAERTGWLRPEINRAVAEALFWQILTHLFENPRLRALGLSDVELYTAVKDILLYGIATPKPPGG